VRRFAVKIEDDTNDVALQIHALTGASTDNQIIAELHGRHETRLAEAWCFLKLQARGEDGALQTNAVPNIFFVRDATGQLGTVDMLWGGAGWEIGASPVAGQRQWPSGTRVISRWRRAHAVFGLECLSGNCPQRAVGNIGRAPHQS
jgi:hypothetical protein